jgi:glycosyltransferase involved in cell wall biosynthesis
MKSQIKRGIAVVHYNRTKYLREVLEAVKATAPRSARLVICDDGSKESVEEHIPHGFVYIRGKNLGVAANKNRALWALQDCHTMAILEDDLKPTKKGWFETYEKAAGLSGIHHFCRVQDKEIGDNLPEFSSFMAERGCTPVFGSSPRGDFTFLTSEVLERVGAFNSKFRGAGYAHGEWSRRVAKAGLIPHPLHWIDIKEGRDLFVQVGDTEGGRWDDNAERIRQQLAKNKKIAADLDKMDYLKVPLELE